MKWTNKGHELDDIGNFLSKVSHLYLYGAGLIGKNLIEFLQWTNCIDDFFISFVDTNFQKQQSNYCGCEVISPQKMFSDWNENSIVIVCASATNTLGLLFSLSNVSGMQIEKNVFVESRFITRYLSIYLYYRHQKLMLFAGGYFFSTKCNLTCKHCSVMTDLYDTQFARELSDVKKDIDLYFKHVDYIVNFGGGFGEPLIWEPLPELVSYIADNYSDKIMNFVITTNASILPSQKLIAACKNYEKKTKGRNCDKLFLLDDYRPNAPSKINDIIDTLTAENIGYQVNKVEFWVDWRRQDQNVLTMNDGESREKFRDFCSCWCSSILDKKLYKCGYSILADLAGLHRLKIENDAIDLNKTDKKELLEFELGYSFDGYYSYCIDCNGWAGINRNPTDVAVQVPRGTLYSKK